MQLVRPAAVAGSFYPSDPTELKTLVDGFLQQNHTLVMSRAKATIVPHAGYDFSGPVAATAYAQLSPIAQAVKRIVMLGPTHHVRFRGLAVSDATFFETPLDQETTHWIESLQPEKLGSAQACGHAGIRGLLTCAGRRHLQVTALDVRNSGDTAGPRNQVVGYGAYVVHS